MKPMPHGREPRFDIDAADGHQGEMWVRDIITGLIEGTVEVKRDRRWADTGRLYIERECRRKGSFRPSGITTTAAEIWAFVLGEPEVLIAVPTDLLRDEIQHGIFKEELDGSHPTRGTVIDTKRLLARIRTPIEYDRKQIRLFP